jgi:hypothetical protein
MMQGSAQKPVRASKRVSKLDWRPQKAAVKGNRGYRVYVIELTDAAKARFHTDKVVVYVGQSWHDPEVRFQQHLDGVRASRFVKRYGRKLRPDLYSDLPVFGESHRAKREERKLGNRLKHRGYFVVGPNYKEKAAGGLTPVVALRRT